VAALAVKVNVKMALIEHAMAIQFIRLYRSLFIKQGKFASDRVGLIRVAY